MLHLTGTPLAATPAELTPAQAAFLDAAIPEVWLVLHHPLLARRAGTGAGGELADEYRRRTTNAR